MTKVSVILPVFNAEKTVAKMLESLLAQTLRDFEILVIDDGSTDNSGKILDDYAKRDSRIRVFHQSNQGVAAARQLGIDNATGEYTIHADADDWVEANMLEEMYEAGKLQNADILIADYYTNGRNSQKLSKQNISSNSPKDVLFDMLNGKIMGSLCHKLIKTGLYSFFNVRFPIGINYCEDYLTLVQFLQHQELRIAYLPKSYYHYCITSNSITRTATRETYNMRLSFYNQLSNLLPDSCYSQAKEKISFGIFTEGFIYDVLTREEIKNGLSAFKQQIRALKSPRWRLGFFALSLGLSPVAHLLIRY